MSDLRAEGLAVLERQARDELGKEWMRVRPGVMVDLVDLARRTTAAEAECLEQSRIVGAGTERILDLMAQVEWVTRERDLALARVEKLTLAVHGAVIAAAAEAAAYSEDAR